MGFLGNSSTKLPEIRNTLTSMELSPGSKILRSIVETIGLMFFQCLPSAESFTVSFGKFSTLIFNAHFQRSFSTLFFNALFQRSFPTHAISSIENSISFNRIFQN